MRPGAGESAQVRHIAAQLSLDQVEAFDHALAKLLAVQFAEDPMACVDHRTFAPSAAGSR